MKKSLFIFLAVVIVGAIGISLSKKVVVEAQDNQRLQTESLGITRSGQYLVADLASFPDGATKLVLRDPNGRVGMILGVWDRAGAERAQIEFYSADGQLVRTINASSSTGAAYSSGALEERVKRLEDLSLPVEQRPGYRSTQSNTENLWIKLEALEARIYDLERRQ